MKISLATLVIALLWISLTPVDVKTVYYPTQRCRVYYDTDFIKIPGQCGTVTPLYPRKLFFANVKAAASVLRLQVLLPILIRRMATANRVTLVLDQCKCIGCSR